MATFVVSPRSGVALLDADPDLAADLPPHEAGSARAHARACVEPLPPGPWDPATLRGCPTYGLLVLEGLLLREVSVGERVLAEPVGPGDVLRPWDEECFETLPLSYGCGWRVIAGARLALLDAHLTPVLTRWPQIAGALLQRAVQRSQRVGLQMALAQVQGVDVRVRAMLWHLAERWGRVTPDGVVLPYALTHETLARLVGARRPSVTTAVTSLTERGDVRRLSDGAWLLAPSPLSSG